LQSSERKGERLTAHDVQPANPIPPHCSYRFALHPPDPPVGVEPELVVVVGEPPLLPPPAEVVGLLPTAQVDSQAPHAPPADLVEPPE